ncbi:metalloregulator ArsR/SmtB family transcription factor [Altererythrobacter indicus]|uniref:Metalloregulator ArsR/SmtB family transcription factor n=1 Tax=Altericroceibacterium indicum TaxID=374177 RepID=A0A845A994_9SPHN|nr:metalloregulator ArsR/SmtB family transcription factor [Altericroceibacterium indicum]MXP26820.1 metalloregulator ArsR/SmtB family transcription factor [Altericroceibacterium indicum]
MTQDAVLFQALSDPIRIRILYLLQEMELSVGELAHTLAQGQPTISKHLKALIDCGLVSRRKEGNWVFLRLGDASLVDPLFILLSRWANVHGHNPWLAADAARLTAINAERSAQAAAYFEAHAAEWDRLRALHVATEDVDKATLRAIGEHQLGEVVDIGTGTGTMIHLLADRADYIIGIDRSPEMLRFGRAKLLQKDVTNAELRQGDMNALELPAGSADTVILHQVLHYANRPAAVIAEAARILKPKGKMIVVDVAPHDREELRREHAHARLGFDDQEVLAFMASADLNGNVVEHLSGGPLTVTIWSAEPRSARLRAV